MTTDEARTQLDPLGAPRIVRMVRRFGAPPSRLYRCWTDPEEIVRWFPEQIEGSLALATRSILVFPDRRVSWDVTVLQSDRRFEFRWPWLPGDTWETTVAITLEPAGYGTLMTLTDGPFDLRVPVSSMPMPRPTKAGARRSPGYAAMPTSPWSCATVATDQRARPGRLAAQTESRRQHPRAGPGAAGAHALRIVRFPHLPVPASTDDRSS